MADSCLQAVAATREAAALFPVLALSVDRYHAIHGPPLLRSDQVLVRHPYRVQRPFDLAPPIIEEVPQNGEFWSNIVLLERKELEQRSEEHTSELQSLMRISYAV